MSQTNSDKQWRLRNPEKLREYRQRYRKQSEGGPRSGYHWTEHEDVQVLKRDVPDGVLAERLGRSVNAIQIRRYLITREEVN